MLTDPAKSIRRATMVAKGIGKDIGRLNYAAGGLPSVADVSSNTQFSLPSGGGAQPNGSETTSTPDPSSIAPLSFAPQSNTLSQVLGTNAPTGDQIFSFKYPEVAPVAPTALQSQKPSSSSSDMWTNLLGMFGVPADLATGNTTGLKDYLGNLSSSFPTSEARGGSIIDHALHAAHHYARGGYADGGYPNTLDQVLGTDNPTLDQIFGFKYPTVAPVAAWPPASLTTNTTPTTGGGSAPAVNYNWQPPVSHGGHSTSGPTLSRSDAVTTDMGDGETTGELAPVTPVQSTPLGTSLTPTENAALQAVQKDSANSPDPNASPTIVAPAAAPSIVAPTIAQDQQAVSLPTASAASSPGVTSVAPTAIAAPATVSQNVGAPAKFNNRASPIAATDVPSTPVSTDYAVSYANAPGYSGQVGYPSATGAMPGIATDFSTLGNIGATPDNGTPTSATAALKNAMLAQGAPVPSDIAALKAAMSAQTPVSPAAYQPPSQSDKDLLSSQMTMENQLADALARTQTMAPDQMAGTLASPEPALSAASPSAAPNPNAATDPVLGLNASAPTPIPSIAATNSGTATFDTSGMPAVINASASQDPDTESGTMMNPGATKTAMRATTDPTAAEFGVPNSVANPDAVYGSLAPVSTVGAPSSFNLSGPTQQDVTDTVGAPPSSYNYSMGDSGFGAPTTPQAPAAPTGPADISAAGKAALAAQMNTDVVPAAIPTSVTNATNDAQEAENVSNAIASANAPAAQAQDTSPNGGYDPSSGGSSPNSFGNTGGGGNGNSGNSFGDTSSDTMGGIQGEDAGAAAQAAAESAAGVGGGSDGSNSGSDSRGGYIPGTRRKRGGYIHRALHAAYRFQNGGEADPAEFDADNSPVLAMLKAKNPEGAVYSDGGAIERALRMTARVNMPYRHEAHR